MDNNKTQRLIASEVSLLLARLTIEHGIEFNQAIRDVEQALTVSYWGELPEGYTGAIVPVPVEGRP